MTEELPQVSRVEPGEVTPALVTALYTGAVVSPVAAGVVALTGSGAVTSFQGLLTNDVDLPGAGSFVYGALLPPKGLIVVDGFAARLGTTVSYAVPARAGGRGDHPPGRALRRDRRAVVHEGLLHGPGDGRAAALPRPRESPGPRPAVRSGAARGARRRLERGHLRGPRRRPGDEPRVCA